VSVGTPEPIIDTWGKTLYSHFVILIPYSPTSSRPLGIFANDSRIPGHKCELSIFSQSVGPVYNDVYVDDVISILLCCPLRHKLSSLSSLPLSR